MSRIAANTFLAAAIAVMLTGCWEDTDVTLHEPGEYKGARDPLLHPGAASRDEALQARFRLVQTDR